MYSYSLSQKIGFIFIPMHRFDRKTYAFIWITTTVKLFLI